MLFYQLGSVNNIKQLKPESLGKIVPMTRYFTTTTTISKNSPNFSETYSD